MALLIYLTRHLQAMNLTRRFPLSLEETQMRTFACAAFVLYLERARNQDWTWLGLNIALSAVRVHEVGGWGLVVEVERDVRTIKFFRHTHLRFSHLLCCILEILETATRCPTRLFA